MEPIPQTHSQRKATGVPITSVAVVNPSILLIGADASLRFFLARDTLVGPEAIHLQGVRLVEIPLGWRLALVRCVSRFCKIRLPDEFEFTAVKVLTNQVPAPAMAGKSTIGEVRDARLLVPLTGDEYFRLCETDGRSLHRRVADLFGLGLRLHAARPRLNNGRRAA